MNPELAIIAALCGLVAGGLVWFGWSLVENVRFMMRGDTEKKPDSDDGELF